MLRKSIVLGLAIVVVMTVASCGGGAASVISADRQISISGMDLGNQNAVRNSSGDLVPARSASGIIPRPHGM